MTFDQPIKETDRGHMTERILQLTLEVIYLLTGEDYGPTKKPIGPSPPSLTDERSNDKKILEVTQKIIDLLTGEVPIRCQDVSVYFSMEEWEYLEGHRDLYKDVVMEDRPPLTSPDLLQANETSEDVKVHMLELPNSDQTLKSPKPGGDSNVVSESTVRGEKGLVHNRSHSPPSRMLCPATKVKEEPSDDDDVVITKILISREQAPTEYTINMERNQSSVCEKPAVHKRHNGGPKPSKTHNGSYNNSFSSRVQKTERKRPYECQQCGKCFLSDSELTKHWPIHTESQAFICSVCGKCFFTESDLSDHLESHFAAETAYDVPFDADSVLHSRLADNDPFRCHYCGETFVGKVELAAHQLVHFKNPYTCEECGRNFLSKSGLVTHQKTHSKHYDCPTCGKSFLSRSNLLLHQEVHLNTKPDLARETEAGFNGDSDIIVHQVDALYSCAECGAIFDSRVSFLQHQQSHLSANSYVCSDCGKLFNRKSSLSLHRRVIHQGNVSFSCTDCGKGFSCHSELVRHNRVHTGEQPYSCTECGKCFSFKSALVRHQRIHSGNRPYVCSMCGKCFSCNSALQRHRSIHLKVENPQTPSDALEMEKKDVTERILSLTLEVIHLLTGEEYIVVQKSSTRPCGSSRGRRTRDPIMDPPPLSSTRETRNVKKIFQVVNNIIHLLSGEVLGCLEDHEDLSEDVVICEQQASTSLDIPKSRSKPEGRHIQVALPHVQEESECINHSHQGSKLTQWSGQQEDFSPDLDTGKFRQGDQLSSPNLCDVGIGTSTDDQEDIEYAVVQIKEELERWKDGEGHDEDHLAEAETSTTKDVLQCQAHDNEPTGVGHTNANSQPLSGTVGQCNSTTSPTIPNAMTYKCPECPEVFSCHSDLFKHQSHHRGLPLFACLQCGKDFTSKSNLVKHQKIHTGEKPFSCAECGKRFREKHYLASHQAVHRGAQLIVCSQCGKGYTSKSNLAKHQRIHTGQKPFGCSICGKSFNQRSVLLAHQRTHTGEKPFSCDLCERRFTDRLQLVRHQAMHSEEKQFCCNECGKSFSRKDLLLKHLATHSVDASPD